jgi:hypothetical protein
MLQIGEDMDYYGGFGEIGQHGREMISASQLALDWARGIERDEPWLRKVLDDAKREYKKRPAWAKPSNEKGQRWQRSVTLNLRMAVARCHSLHRMVRARRTTIN